MSPATDTVTGMLCLSCAEPSAERVCTSCRSTLRPAPDRLLPSGVMVRAAFAHEGAARIIVHRLKYRPVAGLAAWLASQCRIETRHAVFVPIPRSPIRLARSGVDPAQELAAALAVRFDGTVVRALRPPLWWPRHAGGTRSERAPVRFRSRTPVDGTVILVDDVVTTGVTAESAVAALSGLPALVVSATSVGTMVRR